MKDKTLKMTIIFILTIILSFNNIQTSSANEILQSDDNILDVLVINSYEESDRWEKSIVYGFTKTMKELKPEGITVDTKIEYLDIKSRPDKEYVDTFLNLLNTKYQYSDIDVVFAIDDAAFRVVKQEVLNKDSVLYKKQILFTGVNGDIEVSNEEKQYIKGIGQSTGIEIINLILNLHKDVDTINILLDNFTYSKVIKEKIKNSTSIYLRDVKINFIESNYIEDILNQLQKVNKTKQAIIVTGVFKDKKYIPLDKTIDDIKKISLSPIYTTNYAYTTQGVIGGYIDRGEKQGEYIAKEIYNIINGNSTNFTILPHASGQYVFDYDNIYEYNVDISKIPKDSQIVNNPFNKPLISREGKIALQVSIFIIISMIVYSFKYFVEQRKREAKNRKLYERAKEREQLKTDFIVNMSHELRTPLNVILSTTKVVEMKVKNKTHDDLYLLDKLEQINKNSNRLLKLVNNLIDVTKFENGSYDIKLQNLNIVEVIEETVLATVDYAYCKNIDVIFDTEEEEIITAIDKHKIERVILNLLSNSIKYSNENASINVYIKKEDKNVYINVSDTGIGISNDKIDEIFNRFYQVSESLRKVEEGSGIGLCIVEEIIKIHKGHINVYSEVGKGTRVEIVLPINIIATNIQNKQITDLKQSVMLEMSDVDTKN